MKSLLVAAVVLFLAPCVARAAPVTMTMRDIPLRGARSLASASPSTFDMVGVHWQGPGTVAFRTRALDGRWSSWEPAAPEAEDQPDQPTLPSWHLGNPYWTGPSDAIAYRLRGRVTRLRAYFVWSPVDDLPPRRLSIAGSPPIITRAAWGADETIRRAPPRYALGVQFAVVHHTAGTNNYSASQSAAIVRGIEVYHVEANGWNDIGYNFLVDKYGQVFEGRYGGVDKPVIGAHALGFNDGSVGVAVLGTYTDAAPPVAAQNALANLLAWRLDVAHVDPLSMVTVTSGGNAKYPAGVPVTLRAISGHRDTGFTDCPGNALYARLGAIAAQVASIGLPKLYSPTVQGAPGGVVAFRARLSTALPWTVTVTDPSGNVVSSGSGSGTDVSWTWDATNAPQAQYAWTISAGDSVTPATGFVGAAPVPLALKGAAAKPATITAASTAAQSTVTYTLSTTATLTALLRTADGRVLATLFHGQLGPGKHAFVFSAQNVVDGRYAVALDATDGKTNVSATVPLVIDRTLSAFTVTPAEFSPNGDGRDDTVTFGFHLSRSAQVRVDVKRGAKLVTNVLNATDAAGDQSVVWNGSTSSGRARDGSYTVLVTAASAIATTAQSLPVRVDTARPKLRAISFRRLVFWISEPARVTLVVNGRRHVLVVRAGVFSLHVRGRVRQVRASAEDPAGNVSRRLRFH